MIDKSALARMMHEPVRRRLEPILLDGQALTCAMIDLEVFFSARSYEHLLEIRHRRRLAYTDVPLGQETFERAIEVQTMLARTGHHRVPIPDLVIAAAAEQVGATVVHYDKDFDHIAGVTGQDVEWVVARGSVV